MASNSRRPWAKFWSEKWIASPRVRRTTYAQQGLWLAIVARLHSTRCGEEMRRWTADEIADDLGLFPSRRKRFYRDLDALKTQGLVEDIDGYLFAPRFEALQINTGPRR